MAQTDGNRARFFSRGQSSNQIVTSGPEKSVIPAVSNVTATRSHAIVTTALSHADHRGDDIIAQRTRMIETETLFKPKKDRNGKLNLSGLIKESKKSRVSPGTVPSATITEVIDKSSELSQDARTNFTNTGSNSLIVKPRTLNAQATAFIPSNLNALAVSDITVETPINKKSWTVKETSHEDRVNPNEALVPLSGNQHNSFQSSDYTSATMRAVIGTKTNLLETTINNVTDETRSKQYALMPSYHDIEHVQDPEFPTEANDHCVHRSAEKRKNEASESQLPDSVVMKKRKKDNVVNRASETNYQPISSPESYVSSPIDERDAATSAHPPSSGSFGTVLGRDIEHYITSHLDEYERAKARWTDCSREEWEHGAVEITGRFTKILDFVKEHMRRKIMLYASLQARLDDHRSVRDGIASMLKEAKNELVTKTGFLIDEGRSG